MTAQELIKKFNEEFSVNGVETPWPPFYFIDIETYANCCQYVFENCRIYLEVIGNHKSIPVAIGPHNGLMFKNIELLIDKEQK